MIVYRVSCTMSKEIAESWKQFFLEKHLNDVVNTGCFTGYAFRKLINENDSDKVTYVSEYFCPNMEALNTYNANYAAELKAEVAELFQGKYTASRELLEEVA